jgi:hypothetical protein
MLHLDNSSTEIYQYSGRPDLVNWTLEIGRVKGRQTESYVVVLAVDYFGNSFYKLILGTMPALDQAEYSYTLKSGNETIDKGILRYGAI